MGSVISSIQPTTSTISFAVKTLLSLHNQFSSVLLRAASPPGLPIPAPTRPYWLDDPPFPALCDIQADVPKETDVVIIGSGITGAAVAKTLLELSGDGEELRVVVCEARQLCSGATGRNGGHIKCTPYEVFAMFRAKLGPEKARQLVRFQRRHLEVLKQVGEKIPQGEIREVQTVDLFLEREDFENAKREVEEMREWMPEEECLVWGAEEARREFGVNELVVGAISYSAGALWPYRLVTGVWNDLLERFSSLSINTNTPVESISHDAASAPYTYTVNTPRGKLKARHVVHTTNAYAPRLLPSLRGSLTGALAHMSAQRPGESFPPSHGERSWSVIYSPGFDYVTQRPDGKDGMPGDLMIGGGFFRSRQQGLDHIGVWDDSQVHALPLMHIRGVMPAVFEPQWSSGSSLVKAWTGILGFTGDFMPLVGRVKEGEWAAVGFNGEGMVWAWLCGTALAVMVLGREEEVLEEGVGRPGGRLQEWFPGEVLGFEGGRLKRADLVNLVDYAG
ncbi:hypothetical protein FZEAL_303 [Fusarium zealandicum]|uniref:FAD dependent oxidoreductase domain-containing protein n=1 Tax=Fusarium zealandicum TaxID=1053134 RepID=A0A8H4UUX1_9HYPO|nr:hypothetical protein FZEAL_303 [Fusarium zealandicum]